MRVAIIARVSTRDQHAENQLVQLSQWCIDSGHTIIGEYVDVVSGGKGIEKRPRLAAAFDDAHRRKFDLALFWAIDRLSREGMVKTVNHLETFASYGVKFHSYQEPMLSSDNEMVASILLAVLSAVARAERIRISERTRAGLERVRHEGSRSGNPIGRPAVSPLVVSRIKAFRVEHPAMSIHAIAKAHKLDSKTIRKYLAA